MIYLLDQALTNTSHSRLIMDIIRKNTDVEIKLIEMPVNPTFGQVNKVVYSLFGVVKPSDIVLCPWAVDGNAVVDELFNDLSEQCWVVVAAGNFNKDIKDYSPARAEGVITVACFNKAGVKAALSNWSADKELIWIPGTNYDVGWKNSSGTSISAALYAAFLAEAIKTGDGKILDKLIEEYSRQKFAEINSK